jgi:hypothetical protein
MDCLPAESARFSVPAAAVVRTIRQIGEETGQITGMRVLPDGSAGPKIEVSFQASGTVMGVHGNNVGTYGSVTRPDGTLSWSPCVRCEMRCPTIRPITGTRSIPLGATPG